MQSTPNTIERAHRGNLTGLNFAGLVRLSFELHTEQERGSVALTGADINNREEQEELCRKYIESRGGTYVGTYDEPDTSAWKKKRIKQSDDTYAYRVVRPVFEGALKDLKTGTTSSGHFTALPEFQGVTPDGLIVYDVDRLTRDNRHMEDAIETVQYFHRPIIDITGTLDLLTENGRDMARVMVTMAGKQSSATSRRLRDSHYARAIRGITVGGNRSFGWARGKRELIPEEVKLIQQAANGLRVGRTKHAICRQWNDAGVRTSMGKPWQVRTLEQMLLSPRMVGWRVYGPKDKPQHERYISDAEGNPVKGQYPAILTEKAWRAVVAILTDTKPQLHKIGQRKTLLSGIIHCGNCGKPLRGNNVNGIRFDYVCKTPECDGGCGKVAGAGLAIDELVKQLLFVRFAERQVTIEVTSWARKEELETAKAAKSNLLAQFKENPDMGPYIWPEVRKVDAKIAGLIREKTKHTRQTSGPKVTNIEEEWDKLEVEQRRAIVGEDIEAVILNPATRQSNRFDPSRLHVIWRQG